MGCCAECTLDHGPSGRRHGIDTQASIGCLHNSIEPSRQSDDKRAAIVDDWVDDLSKRMITSPEQQLSLDFEEVTDDRE